MWWFLRKKSDDSDFVIYTYGKETKEQSGEIKYNRKNDEFDIVKLADNDNSKSVKRLLPHLHRMIFKEKCPEQRQVAIG